MPARFTCTFEDRSFQPVPRIGRLRCAPTRFSRGAQWGPKDCEIVVRSDPQSLWALLDWLRYGVTVWDTTGTPVWYGFINEVTVTVGAFTFGLSLDTMANKIAVAYTAITPGQTGAGQRMTTDWTQYDESVSTYGTKELMLKLSDAKDDQATRFRDAALQVGRAPTPTIQWAQGAQASAVLRCKGWHELLTWRYYQNAGEGARYSYVQSDGETGVATSSVAAYGQTFQLGGLFATTVTTVKVRAQRVGTSSTALSCELWTNSAGAPGTLLATRTLAYGSIPTAMDWVTFDFTSANLSLNAATTYWIVVFGAQDASNYYLIGVSTTQGYGSGQGQQAPAATWSPAGWDMFFQVDGIRDTTDVVNDIAITYGQGVFPVVVASQLSGVAGSAYGDGDNRALAIIEQQLDGGTTTSLRMLARVEPDRSISLAPEPGAPPSFNPDYLIDADGRISTFYGVPIDPWRCPVGGWARLRNVLPAAVERSSLAQATYVFLEEAEYDVASNRLTPTPRGQTSVFDLTSIT